jgi:DNA repair protein RadC
VDSASIPRREVVESALKHGAIFLIFAHNHPSGNPCPSENDKDLTRDLVYATLTVHIRVLDHIIIGDNSYVSLAEEGLIGQYESEFLDLRIKNTLEAKRHPYRADISSPELPWAKRKRE